MKATKPVKKAITKAKRRAFPYDRCAKLWKKGDGIAEIAKKLGYVGTGVDPFHALRVFLTRMHRGYKNSKGETVRLPHRIGRKTLRMAIAAGERSTIR